MLSNSGTAATLDPPPRAHASAIVVMATSVLMRYLDAG